MYFRNQTKRWWTTRQSREDLITTPILYMIDDDNDVIKGWVYIYLCKKPLICRQGKCLYHPSSWHRQLFVLLINRRGFSSVFVSLWFLFLILVINKCFCLWHCVVFMYWDISQDSSYSEPIHNKTEK